MGVYGAPVSLDSFEEKNNLVLAGNQTVIPSLSRQQRTHSEGLGCGAMHFYAYTFSARNPKGRNRLGDALIVQVMQ